MRSTLDRKEGLEMRNAFLVGASLALLALVAGCQCPCKGTCKSAPETCQGTACAQAPAQPAPAAAVAYPYYTTRGPRDFLDKNPQSIGP
jgi:hypothetical protein